MRLVDTDNMAKDTGLEERFDAAMLHRYAVEIPKAIKSYRPSRMIEMLNSHVALVAVRRLMVDYATHASEGYTQLWMNERLGLSFEALMLSPEYSRLFTDDELEWARMRLAEFDYSVDAE